MKKLMSVVSVLLVFAMILGAMSISVFAATSDAPFELIDTSKKGSIELTYKSNANVFAEKEVKIYQVASVTSNIIYSITDDFKSKPVADFSKITAPKVGDTVDYGNLSTTLMGYVDADKISATATAKTDKNGVVKFENLPLGLYLVSPVVEKIDRTTYTFQSFMIAVPNAEVQEKGDEKETQKSYYWEYDVKANVKCSTYTEPVERKIIVTWIDEDPTKRPTKLEIVISKGGKEFDRITVTEKDNWTYSWKAIDDGSAWSIAVMDNTSGYTYSVELKDTVFYVTGRAKASPKTSDNSDYSILVAMMSVCLLGLIFATKKIKE